MAIWLLPGNLPLALVLLVALGIVYAWYKKRATPTVNLPPGPPRKPIVGNLFDADPKFPFLTYTEWGRIYGDVVYARILDQDCVILNSEAACKDLLDKRSSIYSDRMDMAGLEPYGWNWGAVTLRYGEVWRRTRRIFHQSFRAEAASDFRPMQLDKAKQLLSNIAKNPTEFMAHIKLLAMSVSMAVVYGYDTVSHEDEVVTLIEKGIEFSLKVLSPERATVLRFFPWVLHLPSWLPGGWMRKEAEESRRVSAETVNVPYEVSNGALHSLSSLPSLLSDNIGKVKEHGYSSQFECDLKHACTSSYIAAVESTAATIQFLVLAMVLYPEVQERAYGEIISVVGKDRLPTFHDRESLPYVEAVVREVTRWQPTFPLAAFPHASIEDDVYRGYFIPKGTTVFANTWAITRDETLYHNPSEFRPERFLNADGSVNGDDPGRYIFGWGRRICPGRYVADASLWAAMVSILATFRISKAKDMNGHDIDFVPEFTTAMSRHPRPFPCNFVPRSNLSGLEA
ncbi:hypothetical protein HYDPIDRAFT_108954 [Hydnomerulius pinastri MD-312]|nr:hypothetical protein HYDPIDRAFT_108954 [Hydnomerulius pinastri MD-312]